MNMSTRRRVVTAVTAALFTVTGCSSSDGSADKAHNEQDVTFTTEMIQHHAQAVEMSEHADSMAASAAVKDLAKRIEGAQEAEIAQMQGWLTAWGETDQDSSHEADHGNHSMPGMQSSGDMEKLHAASGAAFDRLYLEMMIDHHRGAVEMAIQEQTEGKYPETVALARSVVSAQQAETTEMEQLLGQR